MASYKYENTGVFKIRIKDLDIIKFDYKAEKNINKMIFINFIKECIRDGKLKKGEEYFGVVVMDNIKIYRYNEKKVKELVMSRFVKGISNYNINLIKISNDVQEFKVMKFNEKIKELYN